jgi:hypothetical protein
MLTRRAHSAHPGSCQWRSSRRRPARPGASGQLTPATKDAPQRAERGGAAVPCSAHRHEEGGQQPGQPQGPQRGERAGSEQQGVACRPPHGKGCVHTRLAGGARYRNRSSWGRRRARKERREHQARLAKHDSKQYAIRRCAVPRYDLLEVDVQVEHEGHEAYGSRTSLSTAGSAGCAANSGRRAP